MRMDNTPSPIKEYVEVTKEIEQLKEIIKEKKKKLKQLEPSTSILLEAMSRNRFTIEDDTNNERLSYLKLSQIYRKSYLSKVTLNTYIYEFLSTKYKETQTEEAISEFATELSTFLWERREATKSTIIQHIKSKKRKRRVNFDQYEEDDDEDDDNNLVLDNL